MVDVGVASVPLMVPIDLEHWGPQRNFVSLKTKDGFFRPLSLPEAFSIADSEVPFLLLSLLFALLSPFPSFSCFPFL